MKQQKPGCFQTLFFSGLNPLPSQETMCIRFNRLFGYLPSLCSHTSVLLVSYDPLCCISNCLFIEFYLFLLHLYCTMQFRFPCYCGNNSQVYLRLNSSCWGIDDQSCAEYSMWNHKYLAQSLLQVAFQIKYLFTTTLIAVTVWITKTLLCVTFFYKWKICTEFLFKWIFRKHLLLLSALSHWNRYLIVCVRLSGHFT